MKVIVILAVIQMMSMCSAQQRDVPGFADVVFLVDNSNSMKVKMLLQVKSFIYKVINRLNVGKDKYRIGLSQFNDSPQILFKLKDNSEKSQVLNRLKAKLIPATGSLNIGRALQNILRDHFTSAAGSRLHDGYPQVLVVVSSGKSDDDVTQAALTVKQSGIKIMSIGLQNSVEEELKDIGTSQLVFQVPSTDLQNVVENVTGVIRRLSSDVSWPQQTTPEACLPISKADIVFLLDESDLSSIGSSNFRHISAFLHNMVQSLPVGKDRVRIGLVRYSEEPAVEFLLNQYDNKDAVLQHLKALPYHKIQKSRNTGDAINFLSKQIFIQATGGRQAERVPQLAFVITSGKSQDTIDASGKLWDKGITVFAVGLKSATEEHLKAIASPPSHQHISIADSFVALAPLVPVFQQKICKTIHDYEQGETYPFETSSEPEITTLQITTEIITTEDKTAVPSGDYPKEPVSRFGDLVFLVDSSDAMKDVFGKVKNFIIGEVERLNVGLDQYHIGLAQYSDTLLPHFHLMDISSREKAISRIKSQLFFKGGTINTDTALQTLKNTYFKTTAGSRYKEGYAQILVLFTSETEGDKSTKAALSLKEHGVTIMAVGLQQSEIHSLEAIGSPGLIYSLKSPSDLDNFSKNFADKIQQLSEDPYAVIDEPPSDCKNITLDIVFLLDESSTISPVNFQHVSAFLFRTINSLQQNNGNVLTGVVRYSNKPEVVFQLNKYNKTDTLKQIKQLSYKERERIRNTGLAIDFLKTHMFTKSSGSRRDEKVHQVAVVITTGGSQDDVSNVAESLRQHGVTVFAVGVENANATELKFIASAPEDIHTSVVESFLQLGTLGQVIPDRICKSFLTYGTKSAEDYHTKEGCLMSEAADIYFLIDGSGSISKDNFIAIKHFLKQIVELLNVGPNYIRVAAVQFSTTYRLEFGISTYTSKEKLQQAIDNIAQMEKNTNTGSALNYTLQLMKNQTIRLEASRIVPRYLIVLTDGESQDDVRQAADNLRKERINVYAVGVKGANETELGYIATVPQQTFYVHSFDHLEFIKNNLTQKICFKQACKKMKVDVMFLVDGSGSIAGEEFQQMKTFMKNLVNHTTVGVDDVQIGMVQFSYRTELQFKLNNHSLKEDLYEGIDNMTQMGGGTLTGEALKITYDYFNASNGGRRGITQLLIVITDGEAQDKVLEPAEHLRKAGIIIYAVGVARAKTSQLLEISGSQDQVIYVENFDALQSKVDQLAFSICNPAEACKISEVADVVFVIDSSGSISQNDFEIMKDFMNSLVNKSHVSKDGVQIGVLTYSDEPHIEFDLNKHSTQSNVTDAIKKINLRGGNTYTAKALKDSKNMFSANQGGRKAQGVPQILIVVTDGESHDRENLNSSAKEIRNEGISVYAVGIKGAKKEELLDIGGSENHYFYVDTFANLTEIQKNITNIVCEESLPECNIEKADIIVLMDGSSSIGHDDFKRMKTYMQNMANDFNVGPDNVRIGMAQYSDKYKEMFQLNEFKDKTSMKSNIENITQIEGNTLIGKALERVKSLFDSDKGGRKASLVPQFLLVITDGDSQDEVLNAANELRKDNINIFCLAVGNVEPLKLEQIAGDPSRVLTVPNFEGLSRKRREINKKLCNKEIKETDCTLDVAIGFDITNDGTRSTTEKLNSLRNQLPDIMKKITSLQSISCIVPHSALVSVAVPAIGIEQFQICSKDLEHQLTNLQINKATSLNEQFLRSLWELFKTRQTKAKVLLIFTDGLNEDAQSLKSISHELRREGLSALITVALEDISAGPHIGNLNYLEFGRGYGYKPQLMINHHDIASVLQLQLERLSEEVCCCIFCKCRGEEGERGKYGKPGQRGIKGDIGSHGHPGEEGPPGNRGKSGPDGPEGVKGCLGKQGMKGIRGYQGEKGEDGNQGIDGISGEEGQRGLPGIPGVRGDRGDIGKPGLRGLPGERGETGLPGDHGEPGLNSEVKGKPGERGKPGPMGDDGVRGETARGGPTGNRGRKGARGQNGEKGINGDKGPGGPIGEPGYRGDQGDSGSIGAKGDPGEQGMKGPMGNYGPPGVKGNTGKNGQVGKKGAAGDSGEKGEMGLHGNVGLVGQDGRDMYGNQGYKGRKGEAGFPGRPGREGEVGDTGEKGEPGPKGRRGRRGNAGAKGIPGDKGEDGLPGQRGSKGNAATVVDNRCALISLVHDKCPCCQGNTCPKYPTELVFLLDMSNSVTPQMFQSMKSIMTSLLQEVTVSESNCPSGARVAVLSYNSKTRYLIHFSDFSKKSKLQNEIANITFQRSGSANVGAAMRFVARNVFKRVRSANLLRKIPIILTSGHSEDDISIMTAALEYKALSITPVFLTFDDNPSLKKVFMHDDVESTQIFTISEMTLNRTLQQIKDCTLCYDMCFPNNECSPVLPFSLPPLQVPMDIAFILDSSRNMEINEFQAAIRFLSVMLDQFVISSNPRTSSDKARVALVHTSPDYRPDATLAPVKTEFDFVRFSRKSEMYNHLQKSVHHLQGEAAIGTAVEWTIEKLFPKIQVPAKHKVIFAIIAGETSYSDKRKLSIVTQKARCLGYASFVLSLGLNNNDNELEELASAPHEQHLISLGRVQTAELEYAQRFAREFLRHLKYDLNAYPPAGLEEECARIREETNLESIEIVKRHIKYEMDKAENFTKSEDAYLTTKNAKADHSEYNEMLRVSETRKTNV
ncbi:collagen alpha-6(VI) chain-like [Protopterus annectens]|uniref:collagen alpha-6(VI) chain-like n=1 Tax=Protopterus annectens TaxID=7888 RepID=UPI001CFB5BED|nr:collagen alpha-6(VI) chain-like [Protopterus annectens]